MSEYPAAANNIGESSKTFTVRFLPNMVFVELGYSLNVRENKISERSEEQNYSEAKHVPI